MLVWLRPRLARRCLPLSPLSLPRRRLVVVAAVVVVVVVAGVPPGCWAAGIGGVVVRPPPSHLPSIYGTPAVWYTRRAIIPTCLCILSICKVEFLYCAPRGWYTVGASVPRCLSLFSDVLYILYVILPWCLCLIFHVFQHFIVATVVLSPQRSCSMFRRLGAPKAWYTLGAILPGCLCALFRVCHTKSFRTSAVYFPRVFNTIYTPPARHQL